MREHTSRVFIRPWPGFGAQKNYGIDRATADWILILDADERVTDALRTEILAAIAIAPEGIAGFEIPRRNFFYGRWIQGGGLSPDYQLRLFRRHAARYDDSQLHERLQVNGRIERLRSPLDHHSMPTIGGHVRKMMRYTTLGALEKLKTRSQVTPLNVAVNHIGTILRTILLRRGYRDGLHGVIVAMFAGMHTFVKYAKAWEMLQRMEKNADWN
jgi:(heptosyl)LPS beta-1,4-glucosyltransferase